MIDNENTWANAVKTNSQDEFHKKFDAALESLKSEFGKTYPLLINGKEVTSEKTFEVRSPSDTRIIIWTLNFTAKSFLYGPTTQGKIIKQVLTSIRNNPGQFPIKDTVIFNLEIGRAHV